jgi:hypothetical protein
MDAPDFVVIGAAKAGTTQLAGWLDACSGIYLSPVKEPHFFGREFEPNGFSTAYAAQHPPLPEAYFQRKPLAPVHLSFVRDAGHYQRLFEDALPGQVRGECSTGYLFSETAAAELAAVRPDAKAIALLRNPIDRALSHYTMALRYGYVHGTFTDEWEADLRAPHPGWGRSENFFALGLYADALERWFQAFPEGQLLVLDFADLRDAPLETCNRVLAFLGEPPAKEVPQAPRFEARTPRFPRVNRWLHASGWATAARRRLPQAWVNRLKSAWQVAGKPEVPAALRAALRAAYLPDQQKLQKILLQHGRVLPSVEAFLAEQDSAGSGKYEKKAKP